MTTAPAVDPRQSAALTFLIVATTLAWSLHVVSFLDAKEALLWVGVAALGLAVALSRGNVIAGFRHLGPCWCVAAAVTLQGALTGNVPGLALAEGLRLLPLLLAASLAGPLLARPEGASRILTGLVVAMEIAAALALAQRAGLLEAWFPDFPHYDQRMYSVFGNEGLLAGAMALGLVLTLGMPWAPVTRLAALTPLATVLLLTGSRAGCLAAGTGLLALALARPAPARRFLMPIGAAILLAGVWGALHPWLTAQGGQSGELRPWFWRATADLFIHELPWGAGLGHFALDAPVFLGAAAREDGAGANLIPTEHAHFDLLEWAAETGLPGLLLLIGLLARLRPINPPALAGLASLTVFSCFHPAFHSAPHALAGLLLYAMNTPAPRATASPRAERAARTATLGGVLLGGSAFCLTVLYPSHLLRRAEDLHLARRPARMAYEAAVNVPLPHPDAWESFGIYLYESGHHRGATRAFLHARESSDSGRVYRLLGRAARRAGNPSLARIAFLECLRRWPWDGRARNDAAVTAERKPIDGPMAAGWKPGPDLPRPGSDPEPHDRARRSAG